MLSEQWYLKLLIVWQWSPLNLCAVLESIKLKLRRSQNTLYFIRKRDDFFVVPLVVYQNNFQCLPCDFVYVLSLLSQNQSRPMHWIKQGQHSCPLPVFLIWETWEIDHIVLNTITLLKHFIPSQVNLCEPPEDGNSVLDISDDTTKEKVHTWYGYFCVKFCVWAWKVIEISLYITLSITDNQPIEYHCK